MEVWIIVFIFSLVALVKGADWFVESAEKIGLAFKISPFIIGVTIVALGTSFPELITAIFAVLKQAPEIVAANAIGSNITNILLIIGLSTIVARHLVVKRSLIDLDVPLLTASTALFVFVIWDKTITFLEGILLILAFLVYAFYVIFQNKEDDKLGMVEVLPASIEELPSRADRRRKRKSGLQPRTILFFVLGGVLLIFGANYIVESVLQISEILQISASLIAITAVAIGTSLPELAVSVRAAWKKKYEIALGNVFGSNVFNLLIVVGLPALIRPLPIDNLTFEIGLPFLVIATFLFIISGISRKIHIWEGLMYLLIYILFILKLFNA